MITQEDLKKELHYNPDTGVFTRTSNGSVAGSVKGGAHRYSIVSILSSKYPAHHLAFIYMTGRSPDNFVDHISGDPFDNRWINLRDVTAQENNTNKAVGTNNKSGVIGVHWSKKERSWKSQINVMGKRIHLGYFKDFFEAVCARKSAQCKHGFHQSHGRINPLTNNQ